MEACMVKFHLKLNDDILDDEELSMFDCFLERFLDMPEHQVLHLDILFQKYGLESFEFAFDCILDECPSFGHKLEESFSIFDFKSLDFTPNTPLHQLNYKSKYTYIM